MKKRLSRFVLVFVGVLVGVLLTRELIVAAAAGQINVGNYGRVPDSSVTTLNSPQDRVLSKVRWEQKLQSQLPLDAQFRDEEGRDVQFGQYFNGRRPVVVAMIFYNCTMLCSQVLSGMMTSMKEVKLAPGKDYDVVVISINPQEGPALAKAKKKNYLAEYGFSKVASGFHFLTGSKTNIDRVTNAAGYFYEYDKRTDQYAHPGGIIVVTPQGKVARYFTGVLFNSRDMRLSLVDASQGKVGSVTDLILLRCFHYDATTGKYSLAVMEVVRLLAAIFTIVLGSCVALWVRSDMKKEKAKRDAALAAGDGNQSPV
jgi:protein SCO1/2